MKEIAQVMSSLTFAAEIRRALGASERLVYVLLARELLKWVGISLVFGLPAGWL